MYTIKYVQTHERTIRQTCKTAAYKNEMALEQTTATTDQKKKKKKKTRTEKRIKDGINIGALSRLTRDYGYVCFYVYGCAIVTAAAAVAVMFRCSLF